MPLFIPASGGWGAPIATTSGATVTQIDFTNLSGFRHLMIVGKYATNSAPTLSVARFRVSTDNGSTFIATASYNYGNAIDQTFFQFGPGNTDDSADNTSQTVFAQFVNFNQNTPLMAFGSERKSSDASYPGCAFFNGTTARNALRMYDTNVSGYNGARLAVYLYGMR